VDEDAASRITLDVSRVNMLFTVSDKKDASSRIFNRDDFEIFETKKPQSILEFTAETDLPLRIGILIDTSNSIRERFRFQQTRPPTSSTRWCGPGEDKVMVVSFDSNAELVRSDDSSEQLSKAIHGLRRAGHGALRRDLFRMQEKLMGDQPRDQIRRAIVMLSDGEETTAATRASRPLEMAHKADVVIYTISTNISHPD